VDNWFLLSPDTAQSLMMFVLMKLLDVEYTPPALIPTAAGSGNIGLDV